MSSTPSRRDREQLRHRQEILVAAEQVFASKGYHQATIEDIASTSEFAIATLYKHFRSKEAIFGALFEEKVCTYVDGLVAAVAMDAPFFTQLDAVLSWYATFANKNIPFFQLFHCTQGTIDWHGEDLRQLLLPTLERYEGAIVKLVSRGIEEGALLPYDPLDLTHFFLNLLKGFVSRMIHHQGSPDFNRVVPVLRSLMLYGAARTAEGEKAMSLS